MNPAPPTGPVPGREPSREGAIWGAGLLWAHLRYHAHRHGCLALAGLALAALALGLHVLGTRAVRDQTAAIRQELAAAQARAARPPGAPELWQARIAATLQALPSADAAPRVVATVHAASVRHGGELARADFRLLRDGDAPWMRYQVTVPLKAGYPQVRAWLGEVLEAWPTAALEDLSLRRDNADQEALEARVRFSVYLRAP